jgi:CRISPR system Cascade subunit CasE
MYLHNVPLGHSRFQERSLRLDDTDAVHRRVMALFDDALPGERDVRARAGILFRMEPLAARVLVQSNILLRDNLTGISTLEFDPYLRSLQVGTKLLVRSKFNPTMTVSTQRGGRTHKARKALSGDSADEWLIRKLTGLKDIGILGRDEGQEIAKGAPLRWVSTEFTAEVSEPELVRLLIRTGIGKAKAFGCGMLSIAILP